MSPVDRAGSVNRDEIGGRDPFNQNSNRSDREKRTTSKGGPVFSKLFRLDRTDPLSFGPKFPEILDEWIAPGVCSYGDFQPAFRDEKFEKVVTRPFRREIQGTSLARISRFSLFKQPQISFDLTLTIN